MGMAATHPARASRPWNVHPEANFLKSNENRRSAQARRYAYAALADVDDIDRPRISRWLAAIGLIDQAVPS